MLLGGCSWDILPLGSSSASMPLRQSPNLASNVSGSGTFRRYGIPQMSATTGSGSVGTGSERMAWVTAASLRYAPVHATGGSIGLPSTRHMSLAALAASTCAGYPMEGLPAMRTRSSKASSGDVSGSKISSQTLSQAKP